MSVDQSRRYSELGEHDRAIAAARRAIDVIREIYGANHPRMVFAFSNLVHMQALGGYHEGAMASVAELRRLEAIMPKSEWRLRNIPFAEGAAWQYAGQCERALPFLNEALARFTDAVGAKHPLTAEVLQHVGQCLVQTGEVTQGVARPEESLQVRRDVGDTPCWLATSAFELAETLWAFPGRRARALALAEEAESLFRKDGVGDQADAVGRWLTTRGEPGAPPPVH